jgi:acyl-CoA dehydrogenase
VPLLLPFIRKPLLTGPMMKVFRKVLPPLSQTERIALETGSVGFEGELFTGDPDWNILLNYPKPQLTAEEQAFLDGPVEELCTMVNDWKSPTSTPTCRRAVGLHQEEQVLRHDHPKEYGGAGLLRAGPPQGDPEAGLGVLGGQLHRRRAQLAGPG